MIKWFYFYHQRFEVKSKILWNIKLMKVYGKRKKIYFCSSDNNIWTQIRQYHFWHILKSCCWVLCMKALFLVNKKSHNFYELKRLATQPPTIHDSTHFEREIIFDHRINYLPFRDMKLEKSKFNREFKRFWTKTHPHQNYKKVGQWIFLSSSLSILSDWRAIGIIVILQWLH